MLVVSVRSYRLSVGVEREQKRGGQVTRESLWEGEGRVVEEEG